MLKLLSFLSRPTVAEKMQRELQEAELGLLAAEANLEQSQCFVDTYKKRVKRLKDRVATAAQAVDPGVGSGEAVL